MKMLKDKDKHKHKHKHKRTVHKLDQWPPPRKKEEESDKKEREVKLPRNVSYRDPSLDLEVIPEPVYEGEAQQEEEKEEREESEKEEKEEKS